MKTINDAALEYAELKANKLFRRLEVSIAEKSFKAGVEFAQRRIPVEEELPDEKLFLSIAALRDDSDIHQWFIHDDSDWNDDPNIFWYKCESESINDDMVLNLMCNDCRKATVEELIKHFNK